MNTRKTLSWIHLVSTVWMMLCLAFILESALRQAGFKWWVIFSLSGHSALLIFLLVSLYLFAFFGASGKGHRETVEHPLTSTSYYMAFYVSAPLIGAFASVPAILELSETNQLIPLISLSTIGATFLTWVIVDPAVSLIESLTPAARESRCARLAEAKAILQKYQQDRKKKVDDVLREQEQLIHRWESDLQPQARELAGLLACSQTDFKNAERKAIDIGVGAWQTGGLECMRKLHKMAMERCQADRQNTVSGDYVKNWWDGIGTWRITTAG